MAVIKSNPSKMMMLYIATIAAIAVSPLLFEPAVTGAYGTISWIGWIMGHRDCTEELDDGSVYQGGCNRDGQRHGWSFYRDVHGNVYVGGFINGEKHGEGTEILKDGSFYHGELKQGKQHGWGFYRDKNGNVYKGYFNNGEKHGPGVYKYANGDIYQGIFKRDKEHGYGIYVQDDVFYYCGKWNRGKLTAASKTRTSRGIFFESLAFYFRTNEGQLSLHEGDFFFI